MSPFRSRRNAPSTTRAGSLNAGRRAFSLLEVLVAMAILAVLVVMMSNLAANALSTMGRGKQKIEAAASVRPLSQTVLMDLEQMVTANGALAPFPDTADGARSKLAFHTAAASPAASGDRPLLFVEYVWDADKARMVRASQSYRWRDSPPFGQPPPDLSGSGSTDAPPIDGVLAFFLTFQDDSGAVQHKFDPATSRYVRLGWVQCSPETLRALTDRGKLAAVVAGLKPPPASEIPFFTFWNTKIDALAAAGTLPADLSGSLQIVQIIRPFQATR